MPLNVPDLDGAVVAGAGQQLAVGAESNAVDGFLVRAEIFDFLAVTGIPQAHRLVEAAGGQQFAVGAESDAIDDFRVALQLLDHLAVLGIPDADGLVLAGRGEQTAVVIPGDRVDLIGVALARLQEFAGTDVPDLDGVVEAAGGQLFAIGTECDTVNEAGMALDFRWQLGIYHRRQKQRQRKNDENARQHDRDSLNTMPLAAWQIATLQADLLVHWRRETSPHRVLRDRPRDNEMQQIIRPARLGACAESLKPPNGWRSTSAPVILRLM